MLSDMQDHSHNKATGILEQSSTSEAGGVSWMLWKLVYKKRCYIFNPNLNKMVSWKHESIATKDDKEYRNPAGLTIC